MELVVKGTPMTLAVHTVDGKQLFKAQDLLKGYGLTVIECRDKLNEWKQKTNRQLAKSNVGIFTPLTLKGKYGGTYLTKREIFKLAGYVSYEFEDAVYEAFEALVEGNTEAAYKAMHGAKFVHEAMLLNKPSWRITEYLEQYGSIDKAVETWLGDMKNNSKAKYDDRVRTLASLRKVIDVSYDAVSARDIASAGMHERALKLVAEYERYLARFALGKK